MVFFFCNLVSLLSNRSRFWIANSMPKLFIRLSSCFFTLLMCLFDEFLLMSPYSYCSSFFLKQLKRFEQVEVLLDIRSACESGWLSSPPSNWF